MNIATMLWGMFFGLVGFGFFRYGRKRGSVVPLVSGVVLMVFPYFVSNAILLVVIGVAVSAVPYFVRI
jgi:hypothetical protein